jgi:hypothetical protein
MAAGVAQRVLAVLHEQVDEQEDVAASLESLLTQQFEPNPQLVTGELQNGLRYVILPNKIPPKRFEAHLEIHAGVSWPSSGVSSSLPRTSSNIQTHV